MLDAGRPVYVPLDAQAMKVRYVSGISMYNTRERLVRMLLPWYRTGGEGRRKEIRNAKDTQIAQIALATMLKSA